MKHELLPEFATLHTERIGDVLKVTIAHPTSPLNAVDGALHEDLAALFRALRRETLARCVLLTGQGRAFSAGGDFAWFPELQDPEVLETVRRDGKQMIWDLLDVELPIVVAVNGPAVGLGASLALLCDVIFAADTAHRSESEAPRPTAGPFTAATIGSSTSSRSQIICLPSRRTVSRTSGSCSSGNQPKSPPAENARP